MPDNVGWRWCGFETLGAVNLSVSVKLYVFRIIRIMGAFPLTKALEYEDHDSICREQGVWALPGCRSA